MSRARPLLRSALLALLAGALASPSSCRARSRTSADEPDGQGSARAQGLRPWIVLPAPPPLPAGRVILPPPVRPLR